MSNSYRIRTKPGVDSSIKVLIDQEFEYLEILSLKILQSQIYTRQCSDYGVIVGRVSVNNGFGIPNAKVSVFIPLDSIDEDNPIISDIYPYKTLTDLNEDGYRYNLLPYKQQHSGHKPTGTFFTREDVLTDPTLIQVYDKYFKYTAVTNESGDYMIFGVPVGSQTIIVDIDLSDIGEFSLSPQDLVRMGIATEKQVSGTKFKTSTNLRELPQIVNINRTIEVEPLWGQPEICNLGITRTDFDLSGEVNIDIRPTAIFMGSLISSSDDAFLKRNCKALPKSGTLCDLVAGPGEILSIRQTVQRDIAGRPLLEQFNLEQGGQVIDENGAWLIDLPMNLDYVVTNEFGEQVLSDNPEVGIPTKAKYRFKIKWNQSPSLTADPVKRGSYLVPNIKEYGWIIDGNGDRVDPTDPPQIPLIPNPQQIQNYILSQNSYAFSVDWNDYGDTGTTVGQQMIQEAINCEDRFYEFQYNKVYTVSQLITRYRKGYDSYRIVGIKDILDSECESENNKFPTNDGYLQFDLLYLLFSISMFIFRPILYQVLIILHILATLMIILYPIIAILVSIVFVLVVLICNVVNWVITFVTFGSVQNALGECPTIDDLGVILEDLQVILNLFTNVKLPLLSYPTCEFCDCDNGEKLDIDPEDLGLGDVYQTVSESGAFSVLTPFELNSGYGIPQSNLPYNYSSQTNSYESLLAGSPKQNPSVSSSRVPTVQLTYQSNVDDWDTHVVFTTSLTISERLNLFNTKAKFFEGVNQIKANFNKVDNSSVFHYDNVITLITKPNTSQTFQPGNLVTFQDPKLSQDPNLTGYTLGNLFGTNAITGVTINNFGTNIQVQSSDPTNINSNIIVSYNSQQDPNDATYARFPIDIEYFQVITGMTLNEYSTLTGNTLSDSLPSRFIFNSMRFYKLERTEPAPGVYSTNFVNFDVNGNPILLNYNQTYNDFLNQRIIFLVRGVDPNTTRSDCKYDLSKLFGFNSWGQIVVESGVNGAPKYKLNIPIQGGYRNVSHNISNNTTTDTYSGIDLYYDSYHFKPETVPANAGFTGFSSNLLSYYSSLDNNSVSLLKSVSSLEGLRILPQNNRFTLEYNSSSSFTPTLNNSPNTNTRGYLIDEIVEGGSIFYSELLPSSSFIQGPPDEVINPNTYSIEYIAPAYSTGTTMTYGLGSSGNQNQIVMRSDRLPTSTVTDNNTTNSFPLHTNLKFVAYQINDDGINVTPIGVGLGQSISFTGATQDSLDNGFSSGSVINQVIQSSQCGSMVPLGCYSSSTTPNGVEFGVKPKNDPCFYETGKEIFSNGSCYVFVTTPLLSIFRDFLLLTEWASRLLIIFGACRNVFGHIFTNNWINGTLYAMSFKNDVFYTSPFASQPNQATYNFCRDIVVLHGEKSYPGTTFFIPSLFTGATNTFYYRSSPYDGVNNSFIGAPKPSSDFLGVPLPSFGGNNFNLNYPTTLMDLGPVNNYQQELVMSDDYDGYVVNKLVNTTFSDVSELLNLFILTRLANQNFLSQLIAGNNILTYFSREAFAVDGDYAQAISVNSEIGVAPFDAANYPDNPSGQQDPIYLNTLNDFGSQIFGVFFSSDTQTRDFLSPKRTIINPIGPISNVCTFNNFNVFTQKVPFYQWEIEQNGVVDSIFGKQTNEWYTTPLTNSFFSKNYQTLDRVESSSRYVRANNINQSQYFKGYIYSVDNNGNISPSVVNWNQNNPNPRVVTVGAPYHFYFGLKRGKTAFDRFTVKWIDTNKIVL
jgi:hypothetical protein